MNIGVVIYYKELIFLVYEFCLLFLILSALESNHGKVFQCVQIFVHILETYELLFFTYKFIFDQ